MSYPLQQIEDQVSTVCSSSGSYQTFVFPCLRRWGLLFSELLALHRRLALFCAACFLAALGFVAMDECKTSIQLCRKICVFGGNMRRLARFAAKPRIRFLRHSGHEPSMATDPAFPPSPNAERQQQDRPRKRLSGSRLGSPLSTFSTACFFPRFGVAIK
jgi:hypothetical protein